ncbi:hypothetical protein [Sphingomonas sp. Leaf37]|uniref:hypothetical protein n=1 Tax=Sphingomonas sp. Leaf37 TaxID=2876552 RepID=UPI001E29DA9E|nr:hypothetical protein [Sphingomonas sp. Leaf37]
MPLSHLPSRDQADASLARFYEQLGHRPPASRFDATPRLSGQPTHAQLSKTVRRLRRANPLPIRLRIARRRVLSGADRLFNATCTVTVFGIVGYVILPAAVTAATRWQW